MKSTLGLFRFIAILLMTFGITYLDFENLNFEDNYKAYSMLILGVLLLIFIVLGSIKSKRAE